MRRMCSTTYWEIVTRCRFRCFRDKSRQGELQFSPQENRGRPCHGHQSRAGTELAVQHTTCFRSHSPPLDIGRATVRSRSAASTILRLLQVSPYRAQARWRCDSSLTTPNPSALPMHSTSSRRHSQVCATTNAKAAGLLVQTIAKDRPCLRQSYFR